MSHYGGHYQNYPPTSSQQSGSRFVPHPSSYATAPPTSAPSSLPHLSPTVPNQSYSVPSFYGAPANQSMSYGMPPPYAPASSSYNGVPHQQQHVSEGPSGYPYYEQLPGYSTLSTPHMASPMVLPSHSSSVQHPPHVPHLLHPTDQARADARIRSTSLTSSGSSMRHNPVPDTFSRSTSPSAAEMANFGYKNEHGTWSCAFPGCTSKSTFQRGCDLRKHYRRHAKTLFCSHPGCPQATEGGFSSKKDRARHEAKHNPQITCEWEGCDRLFSRLDNMKDHVRRIHKKPGMSDPKMK